MYRLLFLSSLIITSVIANYDYFLFTQVWPPSWTNKPLPPEINYFTIHGIWPNDWNGKYPEFCNRSDPFNPALIKYLVPILQYVWIDYQNFSSEHFWKHEWNKHGTCCTDVFIDEYNYFLQGILWHHNYPLAQWLMQNGFTPSWNRTYSISKMKTSLENKIGSQIQILCEEKDILNSVEICFNKNLKPIDCPIEAETNQCADDVYFYPIRKK